MSDWLVDEIRACPDCSVRSDGRWAFCGWHENVAASVSAVARMVAKERKQ